MKKRVLEKVAFLFTGILWLCSFAIALVLSLKDFIPWLMWINLLVLSWALLLVCVNYFSRIFSNHIFNHAVSRAWVYALFFVGAVLLPLACLVMLDGLNGLSWYCKHVLVVQIGNIILLWALACGLVGQKNFHPFFVDLMVKPFYAFGMLFSGGY